MPEQKIKGGVADKYSVKDLAKMHGVPLSDIEKEIAVGVEVEVEHTPSKSKAREIAMDHISEHPRYYTDPVHGLIANEKKLREEIRRLLNEVASDDVLLGAKLKKVLDTDEAYKILDSTAAAGSTWSSGGCGILAEALSIALRAEIYVIFNQDKGVVEHLGVRLNNGKFLDYDGPQKNWVRNFKNRELLGDYNLKIVKMGPGIKLGDIPMDKKAAIQLAELIKNGV